MPRNSSDWLASAKLGKVARKAAIVGEVVAVLLVLLGLYLLAVDGSVYDKKVIGALIILPLWLGSRCALLVSFSSEALSKESRFSR